MGRGISSFVIIIVCLICLSLSIANTIVLVDHINNSTTESSEVEVMQVLEDEVEEFIEPEIILDEASVVAIAQTLYGECRGVSRTSEKAAVAWVILNRVDAGYGDVIEVVSAPGQFVGYSPSHPVTPELRELAEDVMTRWHKEKLGYVGVGRVLPEDYLWFTGDGTYNHFRNDFSTKEVWGWTLEHPYDT